MRHLRRVFPLLRRWLAGLLVTIAALLLLSVLVDAYLAWAGTYIVITGEDAREMIDDLGEGKLPASADNIHYGRPRDHTRFQWIRFTVPPEVLTNFLASRCFRDPLNEGSYTELFPDPPFPWWTPAASQIVAEGGCSPRPNVGYHLTVDRTDPNALTIYWEIYVL
jgi:hypothetical protein